MPQSAEALERLRAAAHRAVGTNQTSKAISHGIAQVVFVAKDADRRIIGEVLAAATARGLEVIEIDSMRELGRACGIAVGAASAAIVTPTSSSGSA